MGIAALPAKARTRLHRAPSLQCSTLEAPIPALSISAGAQLRKMLEAVTYKKELITTSLLYAEEDLFFDQVGVAPTIHTRRSMHTRACE